MRLFLQALTNLVIVCLSSTSKGGTGALMWGDGVWGENMEMVAKMRWEAGLKYEGGIK